MSTQMKGGKLPLSAKKQSSVSFTQQFGNRLAVAPELHQEITEKGLEYRWLDAKKLYLNQGYHENGWYAYKRGNAIPADFKNGNDPDGIVRRGSMILGVRSKELSESHREHLRDRATAQVGADRNAAQRRQAAELRKMAGNSGIKIVEGDDSDDGDNE